MMVQYHNMRIFDVQNKIAEHVLFLNLVQEVEHIFVLRQARVELLVLLVLVCSVLALIIQVSEDIRRIIGLFELLANSHEDLKEILLIELV